jgi:hypothetical protein
MHSKPSKFHLSAHSITNSVAVASRFDSAAHETDHRLVIHLRSHLFGVVSQVSKEEVVQSLRKQSRGAQKTSSQYRGVTKHQKGKWEARIGQMVGRKYKSVLFGLFSAPASAFMPGLLQWLWGLLCCMVFCYCMANTEVNEQEHN